jgi:hypothetical protein
MGHELRDFPSQHLTVSGRQPGQVAKDGKDQR